MSSQLGRRRTWERREERSRELIRRAQRIEVLVIRVLNALAQRGRSPHADLDAGRALAELLDLEGVSVAEVLRWCEGELDRGELDRGELDRGELDRGEIDRLKCVANSRAGKSPG